VIGKTEPCHECEYAQPIKGNRFLPPENECYYQGNKKGMECIDLCAGGLGPEGSGKGEQQGG